MKCKILLPLVSSLAIAACGGDSDPEDTSTASDVREMEVLSHKTPCVGEARMLCKNVRLSGEETMLFYDSISGFEHRWGTAYTISVEVEEVDNPPADGSSKSYTLVEVLSTSEDSEGTDYQFERVELVESTFSSEEGGYFFYGQPFQCGESVDCDTLVELNNTGGMVNVTFEYIGNGDIRLTDWE